MMVSNKMEYISEHRDIESSTSFELNSIHGTDTDVGA